MFDRILMVLEIILLCVIVWQGELIRRYEKWTYEMNKERYDERAKWREQKRQQLLKKGSEPKISESSPNSVLPLPTETVAPKSNTTSAKSAADPSTPTDPQI